jgi:hypothetical protein
MIVKKNAAKSLASMSTAELVDLFEQLSLAEDEASTGLQFARANRLVLRRRALLSEMRHRPGDARTALFVLYAHRNRRCV